MTTKLTNSDRVFVHGLSATGVGIIILVIAFHFFGLAQESVSTARWIAGGIFMVITVAIAFFNFYLSFIRGWMHLRFNGNPDEYRHISGLPLIASITGLIAALLLPVSLVVGTILLASLLIDTGGVPWAACIFVHEIWGADRNAA